MKEYSLFVMKAVQMIFNFSDKAPKSKFQIN